MKKTGILLAALAGLALAGCAGRYYENDYRDGYYRDGYYHGYPSGDAYRDDRDHYRDHDRYDRDRYNRDRDDDRY